MKSMNHFINVIWDVSRMTNCVFEKRFGFK